MKRFIVMLLAIALSLTLLTSTYATTQSTSSSPFTDVHPEQWYFDSVMYVSSNELMQGTSPTIFAPNATMSRGMVVTILYRLADTPAVSFTPVFSDVQAGQWYSDAIIWAYNNEIVQGVSDSYFQPNGSVTREQMATMLYRYASFIEADMSVLSEWNIYGFVDHSQISSWAKEALYWTTYRGLITGTTPTILSPDSTTTRAQSATILQRLSQMMTELPVDIPSVNQEEEEAPDTDLEPVLPPANQGSGSSSGSGSASVVPPANQGSGSSSGSGSGSARPPSNPEREPAPSPDPAPEPPPLNPEPEPAPNPDPKPEPPPADPKPEPEPEPCPGPTPEPPPGNLEPEPSPDPDDAQTHFEQEVLRLINVERRNHGLQSLQWDDRLGTAARNHSIDMVARSFFSHHCPSGSTPWDRMRRVGVNTGHRGEIIASGQRTPEAVVNAWMNSPGHRAAILTVDQSHLGAGFYNNRWTVKFARF